MDVRAYELTDREACIAVFDSNLPDFFQPHERGRFEIFLGAPTCPYFVMELEGKIVGCGGYSLSDQEAVARLVWGMVQREWHKQGLGRFLLMFRLREITKSGGVETVSLDTSQHSAPFFERQGFKVMSVDRDGIGPGLDRVAMVMRLKVCN